MKTFLTLLVMFFLTACAVGTAKAPNTYSEHITKSMDSAVFLAKSNYVKSYVDNTYEFFCFDAYNDTFDRVIVNKKEKLYERVQSFKMRDEIDIYPAFYGFKDARAFFKAKALENIYLKKQKEAPQGCLLQEFSLAEVIHDKLERLEEQENRDDDIIIIPSS